MSYIFNWDICDLKGNSWDGFIDEIEGPWNINIAGWEDIEQFLLHKFDAEIIRSAGHYTCMIHGSIIVYIKFKTKEQMTEFVLRYL